MLLEGCDVQKEAKVALQVMAWSRPVAGSDLSKFLDSLALKWENEAHLLRNWPNTPDRDFQIAQLKRCAYELRVAIRSRRLVNGN